MNCFALAGKNNIVYVEQFFDPQYHTAPGIGFDEMFAGIEQGRRDGTKVFVVEANLIMCINRERSVESAFEGSWLPRPKKQTYINNLLTYVASRGIKMNV